MSEDRELPRWPDTLRETCPTCLQDRVWSSYRTDAVWTQPPGHTVRRAPDGSKYDTCPNAAQT